MSHSGAAPPDFSSSGPESSMDSNHHGRPQTKTLTNRSAAASADLTVADDGGKTEMWNSFTDSFQQVQEVLDRNRVLIQQVNDNHQSRIHGNLVQNVSLIQEINGNINKVVSLYSDLSVNFSDMCHQQPRNAKK